MTARDLAARLTPAVDVTRQAERGPAMVKYTLLMHPDDADALDHLLLRVRRTHGRRITKSLFIRRLIRLAISDTTLLAQAIDRD